jgi:peptide/nickel transport system ATP-binding protein
LALACRPSLLIADEPTTGLDVTTQATIMDMLAELARAEGMATLLITHDLGLAAEHCERMVVMHAGHVVETAPTAALFATPSHPYTCKLIATTPRPGATLADLTPIPGGLPDLRGPLPPCRYLARCEIAAERCAQERPPRVGVGTDHHVLCHAAGTA